MVHIGNGHGRRSSGGCAGIFLAPIIAIIFIGVGVFGWRTNAKAKSWPTTTGTVIESRIESYTKRSDGKTKTMYKPIVRYSYQVNEQQYEGNQISLSGSGSTNVRSWVESTIAPYPKDASITVFYNPQSPGTACLTSKTPKIFLIFGGIGVLILLATPFIIISSIANGLSFFGRLAGG